MVEQTLFLLYFNDAPSVFFFMCFLYEEFLPDRFLSESELDKQSLDEEIKFLTEIAKNNYMIETVDLIYVHKFLYNYSNGLLSHLLMNVLNVPA